MQFDGPKALFFASITSTPIEHSLRESTGGSGDCSTHGGTLRSGIQRSECPEIGSGGRPPFESCRESCDPVTQQRDAPSCLVVYPLSRRIEPRGFEILLSVGSIAALTPSLSSFLFSFLPPTFFVAGPRFFLSVFQLFDAQFFPPRGEMRRIRHSKGYFFGTRHGRVGAR